MEKCRFLTERGTCQIGHLALIGLEQSEVASVAGNVLVPNKCSVTPVVMENTAWATLIPICTTAQNMANQRDCNTFVSHTAKTRQEWLDDFQEG